MKTLVISLLRLGDFIQTLPSVAGIHHQYGGEVDLLTFAPAKQLAPMVDGISNWWTLDRDALQEGLGRTDVPMLTSFALLKEKLETIDAREYDCIVNLTQTYFSAWIAGYLRCRSRCGLTMNQRGQAQFHSPWFRYLNDHTPLEVEDVFHYNDIFFYGSGLRGNDRRWPLREVAQGITEYKALKLQSTENIVLQILTSDSKKNWSLAAWEKFIVDGQNRRPQAQFVLLGAPNEKAKLEELARRLPPQVRVKIAILSLTGALSLLKRSRLLVTGDTSIKHLAAAVGVPVLELSLGSSDWRRTGVYTSDSLILQPQVACLPCPHSSLCSKPQHECGLQLKSETVASAAMALLHSDWAKLEECAIAEKGKVRFLRTRFLSNGFWMAFDLNPATRHKAIERLVQRSSWKFLLNREHKTPLAQYGSESVQLKNEIQESLGSPLALFRAHLDFIENQSRNEGEAITRLCEETRQARLSSDSSGVVSITNHRQQAQKLEQSADLTQIQLKLIRSLKSQLSNSPIGG